MADMENDDKLTRGGGGLFPVLGLRTDFDSMPSYDIFIALIVCIFFCVIQPL